MELVLLLATTSAVSVLLANLGFFSFRFQKQARAPQDIADIAPLPKLGAFPKVDMSIQHCQYVASNFDSSETSLCCGTGNRHALWDWRLPCLLREMKGTFGFLDVGVLFV